MARYIYALDVNGQTVRADEIANKPVDTKYSCLGCGYELIAKVNGQIKEPHFSHKVSVECSGETYLHNLGKHVFYQVYMKCLENEEPFHISLEYEKVCNKFKPLIFTGCDLGVVRKGHDLTDDFKKVSMEKRDGRFIPDLLLSSESNPEEKIYIEIAVTHYLSEEKLNSGNKIIEIPIDDEKDVDKILKAHLGPDDAKFIGFNHVTTAVSDRECVCSLKKYYAFFVFSSGKSVLKYLTLSSHFSHLKLHKEKIIYVNIIEGSPSKGNELFSSSEGGGEIFVDQVKLADQRGIKIRNCYLCKYKGENWAYNRELPIYCRGKKMACKSNQAAECDWYSPDYVKLT